MDRRPGLDDGVVVPPVAGRSVPYAVLRIVGLQGRDPFSLAVQSLEFKMCWKLVEASAVAGGGPSGWHLGGGGCALEGGCGTLDSLLARLPPDPVVSGVCCCMWPGSYYARLSGMTPAGLLVAPARSCILEVKGL